MKEKAVFIGKTGRAAVAVHDYGDAAGCGRVHGFNRFCRYPLAIESSSITGDGETFNRNETVSKLGAVIF